MQILSLMIKMEVQGVPIKRGQTLSINQLEVQDVPINWGQNQSIFSPSLGHPVFQRRKEFLDTITQKVQVCI